MVADRVDHTLQPSEANRDNSLGPSESMAAATIECAGLHRELPGSDGPRLQIRIHLLGVDGGVRFEPRDVVLRDRWGIVVDQVERGSAEAGASSIEVRSGEAADVDLFFEVPALGGTDRFNRFEVMWDYTWNGEHVARRSTFVADERSPSSGLWRLDMQHMPGGPGGGY